MNTDEIEKAKEIVKALLVASTPDNNIAKLCARYPDGFDAERSINRKDDK